MSFEEDKKKFYSTVREQLDEMEKQSMHIVLIGIPNDGRPVLVTSENDNTLHALFMFLIANTGIADYEEVELLNDAGKGRND